MAFNVNLFNLSRLVLEKYVIETIQKRDSVDHVELSSFKEDTKMKIDGKVYTKDGKMIPIQVKTRRKNYQNFSLPPKDIIEDQVDRVFCFIDKTFDNGTVCELLELNELANKVIADENPKIFMLTQKQLLKDLKTFETRTSGEDTYYLIPKDYLKKLPYNQ